MQQIVRDSCLPRGYVVLIVRWREAVEMSVASGGERRQRIGDLRAGLCLAVSLVAFAAHVNHGGMRAGQHIKIANMRLLRLIRDDGPDFDWLAIVLRREDRAFLGHAGGGIEHLRVPTVRPVLLAERLEERKYMVAWRWQGNRCRARDLLRKKRCHTSSLLSQGTGAGACLASAPVRLLLLIVGVCGAVSVVDVSSINGVAFDEAMAGAGVVVHPIHRFELRDVSQRLLTEWRLLLESMQCDPFEQVAQRNVKVFRQRLENLDHALFHARANLHPLDRDTRDIPLMGSACLAALFAMPFALLPVFLRLPHTHLRRSSRVALLHW